MAVGGICSIAVVADEVRSERAAQPSHFDAVDTKAVVLLGFAGAIVALALGLAVGCRLEVLMEQEPTESTTDETQPPDESPPPFAPDPRFFAHLERGGKPSAEEIQKTIDRSTHERG